MLPREAVTVLSSGKVDSAEIAEDSPQYPVMVLHNLTAGTRLPDHKLTLKVGFPVMLLLNIDPSESTSMVRTI